MPADYIDMTDKPFQPCGPLRAETWAVESDKSAPLRVQQCLSPSGHRITFVTLGSQLSAAGDGEAQAIGNLAQTIETLLGHGGVESALDYANGYPDLEQDDAR